MNALTTKNIATLKTLLDANTVGNYYLIRYNGFPVVSVDVADESFEIDRGDWESSVWFTDRYFSWDNFTVYIQAPSPFLP